MIYFQIFTTFGYKSLKNSYLFTPFFDELNSITFITKKASQARYNLTRFADSDVPRHSNLLTLT